MNNKKIWIISGIVIIAIILILKITFYSSIYKEDKKYVSRNLEECKIILFVCEEGYSAFTDGKGCGCKREISTQHACDASDRQGDVCPAIYQPVCGWFNDSQIQCLSYPCAQTYSNSCEACHNSQVAYWTSGACQ